MQTANDHPLMGLADEDLNMIAAFVLVSGSIKDLAREYGVSYPTMRNRLNRLIERLRGLMDGRRPDPLSDGLARLIAQGQITPAAAHTVRRLCREAMERVDGRPETSGERSDGSHA